MFKKYTFIFLFLIALFLLLRINALAENLSDLLTSSQLDELRNGQDIVIKETVENYPWPRIKVYRIAHVSPEDLMAVFTDYDSATDYIPHLLESKISRRISPVEVEADYCVEIPILPDEYYTVRNSLARKSPTGYQVNWELIKATTTKETKGSLKAEPHPDGTLLCYESLVLPGSRIAKLLQGTAIARLRETVDSLVKHTEEKSVTNPKELKKKRELFLKNISK